MLSHEVDRKEKSFQAKANGFDEIVKVPNCWEWRVKREDGGLSTALESLVCCAREFT